MFQENPTKAAAAKLRHDLSCKAAARRYDAYCRSQGIVPAKAQLLAPANVKLGQALIAKEERQRQLSAFRSQKDAMAAKFNRNQTRIA